MLPVENAAREASTSLFSAPDYDVFFARMVESVPQLYVKRRLFYEAILLVIRGLGLAQIFNYICQPKHVVYEKHTVSDSPYSDYRMGTGLFCLFCRWPYTCIAGIGYYSRVTECYPWQGSCRLSMPVEAGITL